MGDSVKNVDLSRFEEILKLNVTATLALLQKAAQRIVDQQQSRYPKHAANIVISSSVVERHISPFSAVYGATKFAVHALAEGLRREVGPKGVRVSLVEPGIVISGFQDGVGYSDEMVQNFEDKFGPLLQGSDVANTIHYIVSQPAHVMSARFWCGLRGRIILIWRRAARDQSSLVLLSILLIPAACGVDTIAPLYHFHYCSELSDISWRFLRLFLC